MNILENREIKFRAWDKREKEMAYNVEHSFHSFGNLRNGYGEHGFGDILNDKNYIKMEYMGLHDNTRWKQLIEKEKKDWIKTGKTKEEWNGKEIYEGDIISDGEICQVVNFINGTFGTPTWQGDDLRSKLVIGNIYENPELLTFENTYET